MTLNPIEGVEMASKKKNLCLLLVVFILAACGLFKKEEPPPEPPPVPPPEPTRVMLEFQAGGDINPNAEGRASPLVLRIYQLKSYPEFMRVDFFSLYDKEKEVLAGLVTGKQEIILKPNEKRTVFFEPAADTHAIGVMGIFINSGRARWKTISEIQPNTTTVIPIQVDGAGLTVR
jgi:type VI secretion system protein VasD